VTTPEGQPVTPLDPDLLVILACPCDAHGALEYDQPADELACTVCDRVYRVEDGIPVLLLDEARRRGAPEDAGR
jgi:uncharacterized protein YbaR (Trm112 family)